MRKIITKKVLEEAAARRSAEKPKPVIRHLAITTEITPEFIDSRPEEQEPPSHLSTPAPAGHKSELLTSLQAEMAAILRARGKLSSSIYQAVYGTNPRLCTDIGTVLNKIDVTVDEHTNEVRTFGIRFLKEGGLVSELLDCRKSVKAPRRRTHGKPQERGKFKYHLKSKGTILLSTDGAAFRSVLVSTIFEFKDFKSKRWIRVRH